jgi:hypothetical protein
MKTIEGFLEALRVKPIYADGFSKREDVFAEFAKELDSDIQILYASYQYECYEGWATVVYYRESTGKYYEVYGGHCSCYGLENQWDRDEEVVVEELFKRISVMGQMFDEYMK